MHLARDSHDSYRSSDDNEDRMVPEPAKAGAYQKVVAARNHHAETAAVAALNLLALKAPPEGTNEFMMTSAMHNQVMAPVCDAETALVAAEKIHKGIPAKIRLGDLNSGQQALDTETELIHHGMRMATDNTAMTIAREISTNTGYRRANQEADALMRQMFNQSGDIETTETGDLTITLEWPPTTAKITASPNYARTSAPPKPVAPALTSSSNTPSKRSPRLTEFKS